MKRDILTALLLSASLLIPAIPAHSQSRGGHRGQTERTQKRPDSNNRPGNSSRPGNNNNRPGNNKPGNNRPGNGHNRPGNSLGRPGSGSKQHPGGYHHDNGRPHHNNWHPTPHPGPRPHPHYTGYRPRPAVGVNVSFGGISLFYSNGLYYNYYSPTQYVVTLPPLGMIVSRIFDPVYQWVNNGFYYVSQGVVYTPVQTQFGIQYRVIDYMY